MNIEILIQIINLIVYLIIGFLAYKIGERQNQINKKALDLNDYADVFLMPQELFNDDKIVGYYLLIKNASSYPIYLNSYILNGIKVEVGSSIIPTNFENWYFVPLTNQIQDNKRFSIDIFFEDFSGRKYKTEGFGEYQNGWSIKSNKRIEL